MRLVELSHLVVSGFESALQSVGFKKYAALAAAVSSLFCLSFSVVAEPTNFSQAKRLLKDHVYYDQNSQRGGTLYCGCDWRWVGKSGGQIDTDSCGFETWTHRERANRLEWEHVVPAHAMGQHRTCWRNGGRENCQKTDPVFSRMEADMHNLVPSVGAANAIRSNLPLGMVAGTPQSLGQCQSKFDTSSRVVEPRDEAKGMVARITFYVADRYNLRLSNQQQRTLMAWDRQYPVTEFEAVRDRRIARTMKHNNDFVTGQAKWVEGYRPRGQGLAESESAREPARQSRSNNRQSGAQAASIGDASNAVVIGNRRSRVYHLPVGCPSYNAVGQNNRVIFQNEAAAKAADFRKAGNCS